MAIFGFAVWSAGAASPAATMDASEPFPPQLAAT